MATLLRDLRYAYRLLVKSPLFTSVVVVTLALGIGLNTAVFSAIDTLLLSPLPGVRAPDELVQLYRSWPAGVAYGSNSVPHYLELGDRTHDVFSGVAAWAYEAMSISASGRAQRTIGLVVSANYFSVLGVRAIRGRTFLPDEAVGRGAHPVAVLSYEGWTQLFGGEPGIVGRTIVLDGRSYTVVGITPREFAGTQPIVAPAIFVPLMQVNELRPGAGDAFTHFGNNFMNVVARLAPGVPLARARDRVNGIVADLTREHPDEYRESGATLVLQSEAGIHPEIKKAELGLSSIVMGVVGLLLLIACVNVANLFLARARDRAREMAIRLSVGARRGTLLRQLMTENLVLAAVSGVAGLAIAQWAIGLANGITLPIDLALRPNLTINAHVLLFAIGITGVTAVFFGLAPALQSTRPSLVPALKGEAPAGQSRSRMSRTLVVAQMALSLVLLVSAGLFLRNLHAATTIDTGFRSDHLLLADVDPGLQGYTRARTTTFYRDLGERLRALPGVQAVGFSDVIPLGLSESDNGVSIPGYTPAPNENMSIQRAVVTPGYFQAMGIPLVEGRAFEARDDTTQAGVIIVNEQFAHRFWPGKQALGKTVHTSGADRTVIGVVPTGKYQRLGEPPTAFMYLPQTQHWEYGMSVAMRTAGDPTRLAPAVRAQIGALDPELPVSNVRSMEAHMGIALLPARLVGYVLGVFGLLGLLLASIGVYGVMAYTVAQRTREIGIRMAIGAGSASVVGLLMRQGLTLVIVGAAIGLAGAAAAAQLVRGQLYGGTALDPVTFVAVPLVLIAVAAMAIWIPARRAAGVDPVRALRAE